MAEVVKVVKYDGSGNYTSLSAALTAFNAVDFGVTDEQWTIKLDESASGNLNWSGSYSISNSTTTATRYLKLTTNTGKSFKDNASRLTNELRYNTANGVSIGQLDISAAWTVIEGLQFAVGGDDSAIGVTASNVTIKDCIAQTNSASTNTSYLAGNAVLVQHPYTGAKVIQCVLAGSRGVYSISGTAGAASVHNCTIIKHTSAASSIGVFGEYVAVPVTNTLILGMGTVATNLDATSNYNATDGSAPTNWGANSLNGQTATDQVESITAGSYDLRAKATGNLDGAGSRDQTYTLDLDIVGQSRPTSGPSIGAWEAAPAAGGGSKLLLQSTNYLGGRL